MRFVGDIALDAEVRAIASGAITDGSPVVVNSAGTVTQISETAQTIGSEAVFESATTTWVNATFDSSNNKVVISYLDAGNSNYGTAIVATIDSSDNSVTYGSPVVFNSASTNQGKITFDSSNNKVVIAYNNGGDSGHGYAIVGTVSGTSISFGSAAEFENAVISDPAITFDSSNNKVVIAYRDEGNSNYGTAIVGTVSGTSISYGSAVVYKSSNANETGMAFDSSNNKVLICYQDGDDNDEGVARVGTISGTSISFGTAAKFNTNDPTEQVNVVFDSNVNKFAIFFKGQTNYGRAVVGTISGTDVSFGSIVAFKTATINSIGASFNSNINKIIVAYRDPDNSNNGRFQIATISGTDISFGSASTFNAGATSYIISVFDSANNKDVIIYRDEDNSNYGTAIVFQTAIPTNLTSENFIGFAHAAYADGQKATVKTTGSIARNIPQQASASTTVGTEVQFEAGDTRNTDATFDSNSNRIVIVYRDAGNSSYGSVVVGTVDPSDNSISFGTPVVFESANSEVGDVVFDSSNNKVVVFYTDNGNSSYGTAIVGTVDSSDNSISFGSATTFLDATSYYYGMDATFDSSNNKIVIAYRDGGDSNKGKAKVGTVSGTSISFGSATEFEAGTTAWIGSTFDTSNNKVVITYQDAGNSDYGTAVVGTVSGTSISFGTPVVFASNASFYTSPVFDSDNSKIVIAYQNNSVSPAQPFAIVGTVSGTSISFGTAVTAGSSFVGIYTHAVYNSNAKKTVVSWSDSSDIKGRFSSLSVSGTSITWDTAALYNNGSSDWNAIAFDSSNNRVVIPWAETAGKAVVVRSLGTAADLTIGQQYFVQTDGTLDTSADDPSVIAGTAIGASDIIVKG